MSNALVRTIGFIMVVLTLFIFILCAFSTLNPYMGNGISLFENCSSILPVAILICFLLVVYWVANRSFMVWIPVLSIIICIGYICSVFQFPGIHKSESLSENSRIKVCTYNVHGFKYGKPDLTIKLISEFIRNNNVDIFCIQEFDTIPDYPEDSIKKQFGFVRYQTISYGSQPGFALAIFSKYPILKSSRIIFNSSNNQVMWSDLLIKDDTISVFNFHMQTTNFNQVKGPLKPGYWLWDMKGEAKKTKYVLDRLENNFFKRLYQGKILSDYISAKHNSILACGDMNANPSSYSYRQIKGRLKDGFKTSGNGYEYTYRHMFKLFRIDYIFHSKNLKGNLYKSYDLKYSDHKPVIMELKMPDDFYDLP
jgi:endonuclease/exonuclease/phosphatase family metal-dependent hydrolase